MKARWCGWTWTSRSSTGRCSTTSGGWRLLRDTQRAALAEPVGSAAGLLLKGVALRLQADLRWLEACEQHWAARTGEQDREALRSES
jgi:hypothetical protein